MSKKISALDIVAILGTLMAAAGALIFFSAIFYNLIDQPELNSPEFTKRINEGHIIPMIGWLLAAVGIVIYGLAKAFGAKVFKTKIEIQTETLQELKKLNKDGTNDMVKIRCPNCKTLNDEDADFCKKCGKSI